MSAPSRGFKPARSFASSPALKRFVGAVAERLVAGTLAAAQPELFRLVHGESHRRKFRPLVRTVTERLAFGTPAAAPPVIAGCNLYGVGGLLRDVGFGHFPLLLRAQTPGSGWDRRHAREYNPAGRTWARK